MKNLFIPVIFLALIPAQIFTQTIPNGSFEDWQLENTFEEPEGFFTTNMQSYFSAGQSNVTKSTESHSGNFAARLETIQVDEGIIPGGIFIGSPGENGITGGIPYSESPDSVKLWAKYTVIPNDTAIVLFFFKSEGFPVGFASMTLTGNQSNYSQYIIPVNWVVGFTPDTLTMILFCSSPEGTNGPGSVMFIDDLYLNGVSSQIPNSGFESWINYSFYDPENWMTSNFMTFLGGGLSATQSTEHFDGSYSIRLETQLTQWNDTISFVTNGNIGENGPSGGLPISEIPEKFTFYYKYFPVGQDTALAAGLLYYYDPVLDSTLMLEEEMIKLAPADEWTYFEIPFTLVGTPIPDTLNIAFSSSNLDEEGASVSLGSVLYIDKVEVILQTSVFENRPDLSQSLEINPNPADQYIEISLENDSQSTSRVEIFNEQGRRVLETTSEPYEFTSFKIDITNLSKGFYLVKIENGGKVYSSKFIKD
jgi:hypothetical protein